MSTLLSTDVAYRVLRLEQQLDSYQRLHAEELEEMRRAILELKEQILALAAKQQTTAHAEELAKPQTDQTPTQKLG